MHSHEITRFTQSYALKKLGCVVTVVTLRTGGLLFHLLFQQIVWDEKLKKWVNLDADDEVSYYIK